MTASSRFDKMEGMILVLMKDGEVVREVKYPSSLRKEFDVDDIGSGAG